MLLGEASVGLIKAARTIEASTTAKINFGLKNAADRFVLVRVLLLISWCKLFVEFE